MTNLVVYPPAPDDFPNCNQLLAAYVEYRRQQIGLTIVDAAKLAGMAISEWFALESGWIPDDTALLHTISGTLMISADRIALFAMISRSVRDYAPLLQEAL
jgi:hypothetical protein